MMPSALQTCLGALLVLCASGAVAQQTLPTLRIAQTSGMGYPLLTVEGGKVSGGFLHDLTERLAAELGTRAVQQLYPRRRIEPAVLGGQADLVCYSSPVWTRAPAAQWTQAVLPQIERVVGLAERPAPGHLPEALDGQRVAVLLGYNFPSLQPLMEAGRIKRINDTRSDNLFRLVGMGMADVLIVSEVEIEGYFQRHPKERERFVVSAKPYSVVDTHCLVSPKSRWAVATVDRALQSLQASGEIARLAQRYGMSMR